MTDSPVQDQSGRGGELRSRVDRLSGRLRLLCEASAIGSQAETAGAAVRQVLDRICHIEGFALGHVYLLASEMHAVYADSGVWSPEERARFAALIEPFSGRPLDRDDATVATVLSSVRPLWTPELTSDASDERARAAAACGLTAALLVPIALGRRIVGIIELFSADAPKGNGELEELLLQVAAQIGRAVERGEQTRLVAEAIDRERQRIGQDLHDSVGQEVAAAGLLARTVELRVERGEAVTLDGVRQIIDQVDVAQDQLRVLSRGLVLRPILSAQLALEIGALVERSDGLSGVACSFESGEEVRAPDEATATHLYRIAQEAMRNALAHAGATSIRVRLDGDPLRLQVRDDGRGLEDDVALREGAGLTSMRYRAGLIGASLLVESDATGTTVSVTLSRS